MLVSDLDTSSVKKITSFNDILDLTDHDLSSVFEKRASRFEESFSFKQILEFKAVLSRLEAGLPASSKDFKQLVYMRKTAQRLRSAYFIFDTSHLIPKDLDMMVIKMGKLKDAIKANSSVEEQSKKISKFLENLLGPNLEHLNRLDFKGEFISTSTFELHQFLKSYLQDTISITEQGRNSNETKVKLIYKDYHNVRKTIRNFYWFIKFVKNEFNLNGLGKFKDILCDVNRIMGKVCDDIEQYELKTGTKYNDLLDLKPEVLKVLGMLCRMLAGENIESLVMLYKK